MYMNITDYPTLHKTLNLNKETARLSMKIFFFFFLRKGIIVIDAIVDHQISFKQTMTCMYI